LAGAIAAVACVDDLDASPEGNPEVAMNLEDIAALSYTSGSTGRPKGVVQTHRSTVARVTRYATAYRLGAEDRFATFGSFAWSGSLSDVFGTLCLGASAGAYDTRRHGLPALVTWLERNNITAFAGITIARRLAFDFPERRLPEVRLIQLGGDTVYRRDVEACQSVFPNAVLAVGMGTTETGRIAEQFIAPGTLPAQEVVPIGFPAPGVRILLVGEDGNEVEPGAIGEIVIQSRDNAVGYWNLPELTAEKFRRDPSPTEGSRYFSGDLGRLLPGGVLQHVGRKDFQVKIRGYQVLTNEVEAILFAVAGVRDVCVVAQASARGGEQLVAFLVRDPTGRLPGSDLQARLRARLPDYMVPQRFVDLDALPKTAAGKPDRRALPVVSATRDTIGCLYVAPRTPLEDTIASIWRDVLALDAVGVEDDFLGLGGDSLQAMRIVHRVRTMIDFDLTVGELLGAQTVAGMAALIASRQPVGVAPDATPPIRPRGGTRG
jgi:acyl-coenzyme A synthetase/AMP-(fatty) acid ligase/aryl carrier-like protein